MAGGQHLGAQFARGDQEIVELDRHVAVDARHRRLAMDIALGEAVDHRFLEAALIVEHVMRDAQRSGHAARVIDVLAGAAGAFAVDGGAVVVKLQGHADHVIALGLEQRGGHRGIDAAGHGDDDTGVGRAAVEIEAVWHRTLTIGGDGPGAMRRARKRQRRIGKTCRRTQQALPGLAYKGGRRLVISI